MALFYGQIQRWAKRIKFFKVLPLFLTFTIIFLVISSYQKNLVEESEESENQNFKSNLKKEILSSSDGQQLKRIVSIFDLIDVNLILVEPRFLLKVLDRSRNEDIFQIHEQSLKNRNYYTFVTESDYQHIAKELYEDHNQWKISCYQSGNIFCHIKTEKSENIIVQIIPLKRYFDFASLGGMHHIPEKIKNFITRKNVTIGKFDSLVDWFGTKHMDSYTVIPKKHGNFLRQIPHSRYLQCNKKMKESFYKDYPEEFGRNQELEESFITIIKELKRITRQFKIKFWTMAGTTLGWYRQCGLIHHTSDIDIAMYASNYSKELLEAFKNSRNLRLDMALGKPKFGLILKMNGYLDLSFVHESESKAWIGTYNFQDMSIYQSYYPKVKLCSTVLLSERIWVPCNAEKFLEAEYGPDIYHPKKDYFYMRDAKNLKFYKSVKEKTWATLIKTSDFNFDED